MSRTHWLALLALLPASCATNSQSSMLIEQHGWPLGVTGPDAIALPVGERYRYGVVLGSVVTAAGERGCNGEVWLEPIGANVRDVRSIAPARLQNMFRFPQLLPGRYRLGVRCLGYRPVGRTIQVRIGHVLRAVVRMSPVRVPK